MGSVLAEKPVVESELEIVTIKIVLPLRRARRVYAAALINETEGAIPKRGCRSRNRGFQIAGRRNGARAELGTDCES